MSIDELSPEELARRKLEEAVEAITNRENDISSKVYVFMAVFDAYVDLKIEAALEEHVRKEEERAYYERCGEDM